LQNQTNPIVIFSTSFRAQPDKFQGNTIHLLEFAAVILELKISFFSKSGKVDLCGFAKKLLISCMT